MRDRDTLLHRVKNAWIDGALEHSVCGAALVALSIETRPVLSKVRL